MNILPFDQGMGDALAYDSSGQLLRDVIIQIDGSWQTYLTFSNTPEGIQTALNSKGWLAEQVEDVSTAWIPGLTHFTYRIYAVVGTQYSDAQIQAQVQRDLAGVFQVTGVSILSPPYSPRVNQPVNNPAPNYGTSTPAAGVTPPVSSTNFLNNLGTGLGISTPIALLAGGVLLVLILKK